MMSSKFFAIIVGAGPGTGRAAALRFAKEYPVVLMARTPASYQETVDDINKAGGKAVGIDADITDPGSLDAAFAAVDKQLPGHKLSAVVFNPSAGFGRKPFMEIKPEEMQGTVNANILGFFNFAQKTLPLLLDAVPTSKYPPSLIVTGATASVRGSNQFAAFATGMWGKRGMAQSLAREYGPQGVHVAHAVIDGVIDIPRTKGWAANGGAEDGKISPASIAETYWSLHTQHRSGFTWEVDIRPFIEKW